jgi:hypothetical protein
MLDRSGQLMYQTEPAVVATMPMACNGGRGGGGGGGSRKVSDASCNQHLASMGTKQSTSNGEARV